MPQEVSQRKTESEHPKAARILCLGDSNTYGYKPYGDRYDADVRWTGILEDAGYEVRNHGANGLSIPSAVTFPALTHLVQHTAPDVITVMLGSNDLLLEGRSPEETTARMEALLHHILANTKAFLVLIAPPPIVLGVWVPTEELIEQSRQLTALYRDLAQRLHIAFADAGRWGVTVTEDGVHFTAEGHAGFAAGLQELLDTVLSMRNQRYREERAMQITQATMADFDGIRTLLKANHVDYMPQEERINGFVTTNMTDEQLTRLIVEQNGVTIAKDGDRVLAFAFAAPWEFWKEWPFFANMISILEQYQFRGVTLTTANTYQYGPICLDKSVRGSGTFEKVFFASLATMADRYPIMATFVNQANPRSYTAHSRKAGMDTAGTFDYNGNHYYLMACATRPVTEE